LGGFAVRHLGNDVTTASAVSTGRRAVEAAATRSRRDVGGHDSVGGSTLSPPNAGTMEQRGGHGAFPPAWRCPC